jgi:halogenation protein CepH
MNASDRSSVDVIVVGGGPGGSTVTTFIAMQGYKVRLIEKQRQPIYRIGESLLPATLHGICPMLGVSKALKDANFVPKMGGTFREKTQSLGRFCSLKCSPKLGPVIKV